MMNYKWNVRFSLQFHHVPNVFTGLLYSLRTKMSERKNNRGKIQIMGDILALATAGIKKTHIMYKANLSYEQVVQYLSELMEKRLIVQDISESDDNGRRGSSTGSAGSGGVIYRTTEKGHEFLRYYMRIIEFLEEPQGMMRMPYISA